MIVSLPLFQALQSPGSPVHPRVAALRAGSLDLTRRIEPTLSVAPAPNYCPDCGGRVARASGCMTCLGCGWGKCG